MKQEMNPKLKMDKIVSFAKRRGFVFPSSEIYGGLSAVYDYGHYGVLLKTNIQNAWWKHMVQLRDDVYGLDSAIFMHPMTWKASGHIDGFNDPQIDCRDCKARMRADHLLEEFNIDADKASIEFINNALDKLRESGVLKCSFCSSTNLTPAKQFSMMVKSNFGSPTEEIKPGEEVYLRPETCGGIYLQYKNVLNSIHPDVPFGIAQIGKAFRNEIVARQFIYRTREFEQMEMQYFIHPKDTLRIFDEWKATRWNWYLEYGISKEKLNLKKHDKLAHYASDAYDIEFNFEMLGGFKEVEGIHARGDWDLSQHQKYSGEDLTFTDRQSGEKFLPHIVETSVGLGRLFLMFLDSAYVEEEVNGETRVVLKLDKRLAPIKIAVFPLFKNKPDLVNKAREIYNDLSKNYVCEFDESGNVGKRYRKQDEIGTPYCVTIDFDSLTDEAVTIRDRDSMLQERIKIADLKRYFSDNL